MVENRNCSEKSKFWSKIEINAKNRNESPKIRFSYKIVHVNKNIENSIRSKIPEFGRIIRKLEIVKFDELYRALYFPNYFRFYTKIKI